MPEDTFSRVVNCIAATTRYPVKLLGADADLENDLGIDSVKRLEIVVALEEEFGLPLSNQQRDPAIRTITDIANWVQRFQGAPNNGTPNNTSRSTSGNVGSLHSDASTSSSARAGASYSDAPSATLPVSQSSPAAPSGHSAAEHYIHSSTTRSVPQPHFTAPSQGPKASNGKSTPLSGHHDPTASGGSLSGRVALVTGSGRGVGRTIARVLAARGATVIVNSFHSRELGEQTAAEICQQGGSAIHLWGSVANPKHVDDIFAQIESQFGRLDILVCNASDGRIGSFMDLTSEDWDRAFRTNVSGHHQCAIKATPLMQRGGGGSIVTLSAVGAKGYVDGLGSQGVVKAAVETLTRYLAGELGKYGIRANCVAGGPVYGELIDQFPNAASTQNHWETLSPDGQLSNPMDLANTIAFLVSDQAAGINGAVWMVDHGFSAMAAGHPAPTHDTRSLQQLI